MLDCTGAHHFRTHAIRCSSTTVPSEQSDAMQNDDPYDIVDAVLMPWAKRHRIRVATSDRDDPVRSIWVHDFWGRRRAQMWLGVPDSRGAVTVTAAALDPKSDTQWGARETRYATLETLEAALEELRPIVFGWAGWGART
jgi:hypothetical protein